MRDEKIINVLFKKAVGYDSDEVVEEYGYADGEEVLLKKKVTRKNVPPDIQAIKMLQEGKEDVLSLLTDDELKKEKEKFLNMLKEVKESNERGKK